MSNLVESVDHLLEDSFSSGAFRITARKFAPKLAAVLKTKVKSLKLGENDVDVEFEDGTSVQIEVEWRQSKPEFKVNSTWSNGRYFVQWLNTMPKMFDRVISDITKTIKTRKGFKPTVELVRGAPDGSVGIHVTHKLGRLKTYTARKNGSKFDIWHGGRAKAPSMPGEIIATASSIKAAQKAALAHAMGAR
jgi:hypothetical protein